MRRFVFTEDEWKRREKPRRYILLVPQQNAVKIVASVTVWLSVGDGTLREEETLVVLAADQVVVESAYKFDGEVRLSY
jgi:hypothetical protein